MKKFPPLRKNTTWEPVDLPEGKKTVGLKWIYNIKYNEVGAILKYKARLDNLELTS